MAKKKQKKKGGGQAFLSEENFVKQRVRSLQLGSCYIDKDFQVHGEGTVVVSRKHTGGRISYACFLVDIWCVGVKSSLYRLRRENDDFDELIDRFQLEECSYEEAHNWIYGAIEYAEEGGIAPDKSFALTKFFLEEDTDDIPIIEHEFGYEGKHFLVCHSGLEASRYLPLLRKTLGEGNFHYMIGDRDLDSINRAFEEKETDEYTMEEILNDFSKGELLLNAWIMGLEMDHDLDETAFKKQYRDKVLENVEQIIYRLPFDDYAILLYSKVQGMESLPYRSIDRFHDDMLVEMGLAYLEDYDEDRFVVNVASDFLEKAIPFLENEFDEDYKNVHAFERKLEGLVNLLGEVEWETAIDFVKKSYSVSKENAESFLLSVLNDSSVLKWMLLEPFDKAKSDESVGLSFQTRFGPNSKKHFHEMLHTPEVLTRPLKMLDKNVYFDVGLPSMMDIPVAEQENFMQMLDKLGRGDDGRDICFNIWIRVNLEDLGETKYGSYRTYFHDKVLGASHPLYEKAMRALEEYVDHLPRWILRGASRAECK